MTTKPLSLTRPLPDPTKVVPPDEKNNLGKLSVLWCHVLLLKFNEPFIVVEFKIAFPITFKALRLV